jgi:hypothetical protein
MGLKMASDKLTLKNIMVFDYLRRKLEAKGGNSSVKAVFVENKDEIKALFQISTYNSFNRHCTKVMAWEAVNGLSVGVLKK